MIYTLLSIYATNVATDTKEAVLKANILLIGAYKIELNELKRYICDKLAIAYFFHSEIYIIHIIII